MHDVPHLHVRANFTSIIPNIEVCALSVHLKCKQSSLISSRQWLQLMSVLTESHSNEIAGENMILYTDVEAPVIAQQLGTMDYIRKGRLSRCLS